MLRAHHLGLMPYRGAWALQERLRGERAAGAIPDTLLLCEHPPVFTVGRQDCRADWRASDTEITEAGIEMVQVNRGGRITYHGPGQLVGYFIVDLRGRGYGVREFVGRIEALVMRTLADFGVPAERDPRYPGVWVRGHDHLQKIAAIGLHISRGITQHGFALNVAPEMRHYRYIVPCGIADREVTSLKQLLGPACPTIGAVATAVVEKLPALFEGPYAASNVGRGPVVLTVPADSSCAGR